MRVWVPKDKSRKHVYCLSCRYEREDYLRSVRGLPPRKRNFGSRCRRGHLKSPSNWRINKTSQQYYCYRCHMEREAQKPIANGVLVKSRSRTQDQTLLRALREIGRPIKCAVCGNDGMWRGKPMPLDIHFKDGDYTNAQEDNLRILCPNCVAQMSARRKPIRQDVAA